MEQSRIDRINELARKSKTVGLTEEEKAAAEKIALKKGIYISGGSDHSGLCGGEYSAYKDPKSCPFWLEPTSVGTTESHFAEILHRRIAR